MPTSQNSYKGPFAVSVARMVESCGTSYLVVLENSERAPGASIMDTDNRITPSQHSNLDYIAQEARDWAEFLGAPMEPLEATIEKLYAEASSA